MIFFHEGMPRSGKSYAAFADHIISRLKAGRKVYIRIDGLDEDQYRNKVAEVAGLTRQALDSQLIYLSPEDVPNLATLDIDNDSLVVIDELQNYWPSKRGDLPPALIKWISEHGHHGLDVLTMGQLLTDCHKTWVNRTNRKIQFVKKDMLGKPDEYKWRMFTGSPDGNGKVKFTEVQQGDGVYDPVYFGCYKSHSDGTENKGTYSDDRANVWKSPMFRKWLPLLGIAVLSAVAYLIYLFNGGLASSTPVKPVKVTQVISSNEPGAKEQVFINGREVVQGGQQQSAPVAIKAKEGDPFELPDIVGELSKSNRIRLAYVSRSATRTRVIVEWRDSAFRVVDQMDNDDLEAVGWHVATTNNNRMVILASPEKRLIATAWPIEERKGEVPEEDKDRIRREGRAGRGVEPLSPDSTL